MITGEEVRTVGWKTLEQYLCALFFFAKATDGCNGQGHSQSPQIPLNHRNDGDIEPDKRGKKEELFR